MSYAHYERLSALDATFVRIEDVNTHMHVAAALLFEAGPLATPGGGVDVQRIRDYVAARLHLIPRYRQRLAYIPFEQHPVWIDDPQFNVFYHIRHSSLPRPGEERQLKRLCGRLLSQKLDLTKPLWEIWVIEGLGDGRFALVAKVHHCMVDGISGMDLLTVLLSPTPEPDFVRVPPWRPRPIPSTVELLTGEMRRRSMLPLDLVRAATRAVTDPRGALAAIRDGAEGMYETVIGPSSPASPTPFNPPQIGPHRRFDWLRLDLDAVKAVKARLGGTVNDVVLAIVVGALRRFLAARGHTPETLDFRAMIPVSLRTEGERGTLGNRVAQMVARLPLAEADPRRRYAQVVETTLQLKHSRQVRGSELLQELADWTATGVLAQLVRLAARLRAYNVVVTNVPGPPVPLFLLGARLCETYPMVPLFSNQGIGFALFSYAGGLFWGLSGDWDAVPELHELVEDLRSEFDILLEAAGVASAA